MAKDRFGLAARSSELVTEYHLTLHMDYRRDEVLIDRLRELIDGGWRIGVVTNGGAGQDEKVDALGIRPLLSCCVVSGTVGIRKPDPGIFRIAVEQAGGPGDEVPWMVGDHPRNDVAGAHLAGLRALWLELGRVWDPATSPPDAVAPDLPSALRLLEGASPDR
jgi:HAD superfamily hydrolase (TIGR01549 family)